MQVCRRCWRRSCGFWPARTRTSRTRPRPGEYRARPPRAAQYPHRPAGGATSLPACLAGPVTWASTPATTGPSKTASITRGGVLLRAAGGLDGRVGHGRAGQRQERRVLRPALFLATGAHLLWRASASFALRPVQVLADGTYLAELKPPPGRPATSPPASQVSPASPKSPAQPGSTCSAAGSSPESNAIGT